MISIITPVLNGAKFIEKNIQSIHKLTIPFEHIIVDGGSTDATLEIVNKYPHLILLHQTEKNGMYGAIDLGFKQAKGDYIGWVNCDDEILPSSFGEMYNFAKEKSYDFVNSDSNFYFVKNNKHVFKRGSDNAKFFLKRGILPFVQPSSVYKRDFYYKVGGLNSNFKIAGDIELFYRMAIYKNSLFGYYPKITTIFLKYGNSLGDRNSSTSRQERLLAGIPNPSFISRLLYRMSNISFTFFCFK